MMIVFFQYILTVLFMLSVGTMLYLSVRAMSRFEEEAVSTVERKGFWERWTSSGLPEKIDLVLNRVLHRFLRRLKIILLKTDNFLTAWLKKTRLKDETAGNGLIDFKEIISAANGQDKSSATEGKDLVSDISTVSSKVNGRKEMR